MNIRCLLSVLLGAMTFSFAFGQVIISDIFDYSGDLTNNGWVLEGGKGNNSITSDGSLVTLQHGAGSKVDVSRSFTPMGATDTTYMGFDVSISAADISGLDANGLSFGSFKDGGKARRGNVGILQPGSTGDFTFAVNAEKDKLGQGGVLGQDYSFDTWYRLVVSWNAATGESRLWVNPTDLSDPYVSHTGGATGVLIEKFVLRQRDDYSGIHSFDSLALGHTFGDVAAAPVPEPASYLVILAGLVTFFARRKRTA